MSKQVTTIRDLLDRSYERDFGSRGGRDPEAAASTSPSSPAPRAEPQPKGKRHIGTFQGNPGGAL